MMWYMKETYNVTEEEAQVAEDCLYLDIYTPNVSLNIPAHHFNTVPTMS